MSLLSEINFLVKKAALGMPTLPFAQKPMRQGDVLDGLIMLGKGAWGVLGAGAGLAKSIADRKWTIPIAPMSPMSPVITVGKDRPEGSWGDYLRAGWNAGVNHGDLVAAGAMEGAAKALPFVPSDSTTRFADFVKNEKVEKGMDTEVADRMRSRGRDAGLVGGFLAPMPLYGKAFGAGLNAIGKVSPAASKIIGRGLTIGATGLTGADMYANEVVNADRIDKKRRLAEQLEQNKSSGAQTSVNGHTAGSEYERARRALEVYRKRINAPGPVRPDERAEDERNARLIEDYLRQMELQG